MSDPVRIITGDVRDGLRSLAERSVQCCVTSPPYWGLRDYGVDGQIGLEATPERFVETMVEVFGEVRRVLRDDGTLWLNLGDSYARQGGDGPGGGNREMLHLEGVQTRNCTPPAGLKPKDLCMMPWRVALALQADGWWLRSVICWHKRSPMPESVTDRPTSSWEPIFLLAKSDRYFYDAEAVKEKALNTCTGRTPGNKAATRAQGTDLCNGDYGAKIAGVGLAERNMRNVWTLSAEPYSEAHFATFPSEIPRRAIKAGTSEKGCCPACGTPWDRVVERSANKLGLKNGHHREVGRDAGLSERTDDPLISATGKTGEPRTVGWKPGCPCPPAEPVPCVVLDPFLGSGTTIAAARQLGRHGVGIELNPTYAEMARVRIAKAEKPHTYTDHREPAEKGLFA